MFTRMWRRWIPKQLGRPAPRPKRFRPTLGNLEDRIAPASRLFALPLNTSSIVELNPSSGAVVNSFNAPEPNGGGEVGLAFDGSRLFYINGGASHTLYELNPNTGAVVDSDVITAGSGHYDGLAVVAGQVYIQDWQADQIFVFDPGPDTITRALTPGVDLVGGLAGASNPGGLIATVGAGGQVIEMDPATGEVTHSFTPGSGTLLGAAVVNGDIYLGSSSGNVIYTFSRSGTPLGQVNTPWPVGALASDDPGPAGAQLVNGDFETGNTAGWSEFNAPGSGSPGYQAYIGPNPQQSGLPAPPQGTYAAYDSHNNAGTYILYQDVTLPAGQSHSLSLQVAYQNRYGGGFITPDTLDYRLGPNQQFRIDVVLPTADLLSTAQSDVLLNVFRTQIGEPAFREWSTVTADLSAFAGQTVRLRIAVANNQNFLFGAVDDVRLVSSDTQPTGTVRGVKFNDLDGDGTRDAGEPGLSGWTIYADLNNNRQLDAGEPSTVTGADGSYSLTLAPGSYNLREVAQPGWVQTAPGRFSVNATGNDGTQLITIDLAAGTAAAVGPFGVDQTYAGAFTPDGTLWTIIHGFDPGLAQLARVNPATGAVTPVGGPNWTGSPLIALEADAAGTLYGGNFDGQFYRIDKVTGAATLVGSLGFSYVMDFAFDDAGTLWAVDGGNGLWRVNPATGQGTFAANIFNVDAAVMGLLEDPRTGTLYATTYADNSALFRLNPATGEATRVGSNLGLPFAHGGDIGLFDSHSITLTAEATLDGRDFGNERDQGTLAGVAFDDRDGDGTRDAGEPALAGRTVYADLNNNRQIDAGEPSVVTAADGSYALTVPSGRYVVRQVSQAGWLQTAPLASRLFAARVNGTGVPETIYELDATGAVLNTFPGPAPIVIAGPQGLAASGESLFYVDGSGSGPHTLYELDPATGAVLDSDALPNTPDLAGLAYLNGLVYAQVYATDQLVVFDPVTDTVVRTLNVPGDMIGGLAGAPDLGLLFATNGSGQVLAINPDTGAVVRTMRAPDALTGGLAYYRGELIADSGNPSRPTYRLDPQTGTVLGTLTLGGTGPISALGGDGTLPAGYRATVTAGRTVSGLDFGNQQAQGTVSGVLFNDLNFNGARDAGEPALAGRTVYADLNNNRTPDAGEPSAITGSDGSYSLTLSAGSALIREVVPAGWRQTDPTAGSFFSVRVPAGTGTPVVYEMNATGAVLRSFAAPGPVRGVGPQGLADAGGSLFYVDGSQGPHTLYELNSVTGAVIDADLLPDTADIAGLAYLDGLVYAQVYPTHEILVFDPTSDTVVNRYTVAADIIGGLAGAWDRGLLYGTTNNGVIYGIDPATGAVVQTLLPPNVGPLLGGLAYLNGELIAAPFSDSAPAFRVNPDTGAVLGTITLGGTGAVSGLGGDGADAPYRVTVTPGSALTGRDFGTKPNAAPVAVDDAASVTEDFMLGPPPPGVLGNDTDADPRDSKVVVAVNGSAAAVGQTVPLPSGALLTMRADGGYLYDQNGQFNYLPTGQTATDSFTYTVRDGRGATATATVTVTITGANDRPFANDESYSYDEDAVFTVGAPGVLANDTDPDGDPLSAVLAFGPAHGTVVLNADGSFTYTPAANYNGPDAFGYRASDGSLTSNIATVSLTIYPVNDAPVARDDAYGTDEDTALTVNAPGVLGNDTDADGDPVHAVLVSGPSHGTLALNGDGSFTYTPLANFNGTDSFTYKANDGAADSTAATVTITVRPVSDAPVAANDAYATDEDTALTVSAPGVLVNDTDADGDSLHTVLVSGPGHGTLALNADGSFTYTPAANFNGSDSFTYKANDGAAESNTATVTITVRSVNDVPVARDDAFSTDEDTAVTVAAPGVLGNDTDADGDALRAVLVSGPAHGSLALNADGSFTYTPLANFNGTDSFRYKAGDGVADSNLATVTLTVRPVNDAPVARPDAFATDEDTALTVGAPGVLGNDTDADGDALTAALVSGPTHGTLALNADGSFAYTPAANFSGTDSFSYRAGDGTATSDPVTVSLTVRSVNDVPVARDDAYATDEDTALAVGAPGLLGNDTDADGDPLHAVLVSGPAHGTLALNANGGFTYTPAANFNGTDSFTYKASDGTADSNAATVTITVRSVNDVPVARDDTFITDEDTALTVGVPGVLRNDTDADGDALTAALVSGPSHGTLGLNADGSFTYTPQANFNGTDSFTYKANDGAADSNAATVTITVRSVNDAPVARDDAYATDEDAALTVGAPGVLGNDADADGDNLSAVLVSGPGHGTLAQNANGSFTYTPAADFNGTDSFSYRASDGTATSGVAAVTITVRPVNDAPVARNDAYSTNEDTALTVGAPGLLGNDTDTDGDALSAVLVNGPAHGTLALNANGSFAYTPAANYNGPDSFTYTARDGSADSNTATVAITVNPVNDAPVATGDAYATDEDTALTVSAPGVLGNDTDPDGDALSAVLVSEASHGTLALNSNGSFTYTPLANFNGTDSFMYKANDGAADSNVATVTITVRPGNDPPVAANDAYTLAEDNTLTVPAGGVLANDTDTDGDALSAVLVSGPSHGTLALNANGSFSYTPAANYNGSDSFTYKANDGAADSNAATVTLTITEVPDVARVEVNQGAVQRSRVTQIAVTFDSVVTFLPGAFTLTRAGDGLRVGTVNVTTATVGGQTVATLTFTGAGTEFGSLADGRWTLQVVAANVRGSNGATMAGDSTTGLTRLFGDADGDGDVDALDEAKFNAAFGRKQGQAGYVSYFDYDQDGRIDPKDRTQFRQRLGTRV